MEFHIVDKKTFAKWSSKFSELYEMCFNQCMTEDEISWRYLYNPNNEIIACFAFDEGKLVANYSVSPTNIYYDGKSILTAQSLNTMTHPEYMGRGLFVEMAKLVYEFLEKNNYKIVFGFPNNISNRTFIEKLGWRNIYEIPMLELELKSAKNYEFSSKGISKDHCFAFNYEDCFINTSKIGIEKNNTYLRWRYGKHPTNQYLNFVIATETGKVCSAIVCKEYQNRLNIIDYSMKNSDHARRLFLYCIDYAIQLKKEYITLWSNLGTKEHLFLEKCGFKNAAPVTYFGARVFGDSNENYYNFMNWDIKLGDYNVY